MEENTKDFLDLSKQGLKKIEKAPEDQSKSVINLILDHNELQRLDNIDTYTRVENLSICNNFLLRMHSVSKLTNIRILSLNNNGILQIEGLKDLIYLKVLKLAGNNIKSIEHLNHNTHLEHLDLSNNQISFVADISYLKHLKHLNLERNKLMDLRQCDRYVPPNLEHLGVGHNNIQDLNEICHLVHLNKLDSFSIQGNPCVQMAGKDKMGFDYRPFVINWIMSVKTIDGFVVSAIESLKAEWLYSQGKGRHYHAGQHRELCEYLASTCPLTADALDTEDQRKLRLILSKAQHHQQQLKDQTNSPVKSKLQSPRMQSRIASRHMGRSPDRLSNSYHAAMAKNSPGTCSPMSSSCTGDISSMSNYISNAMSQSYDSPGLMYSSGSEKNVKTNETVPNGRDSKAHAPAQESVQKVINQSLEAASKMVPVPESLMSPDYQDSMFDIQSNISKATTAPLNTSNPSSQSSSSSPRDLHDNLDRVSGNRQISQASVCTANKNFKGSPKLTRSAMSSPKLRSKTEQRKGSLTKLEMKSIDLDVASKNINNKINGVTKPSNHDMNNASDNEHIALEKLQTIKLASNQRRQKKISKEVTAAVTIQKMWRGYRSRNLNKDTQRILHAIQAARASQHIQRLTCDMEATKAALESERKIQQLQMQAINALWKKVSTLQAAGEFKQRSCEPEENTEVLRQLTETCFSLQTQVVELQSCMQQVLSAVSGARARPEPVATQTDITAVTTPQEERCSWLRRPQTLPLSVPTAPLPTVPKPTAETRDEAQGRQTHVETPDLNTRDNHSTVGETVRSPRGAEVKKTSPCSDHNVANLIQSTTNTD